MKITKVTLQNFRGISSLELDFPISQNIIALVGNNGVGKSSILDAITMLLFTVVFVKRYGNNEMADLDEPIFISKDSDVKISNETMSCDITLSNGGKDCNVGFWRHPVGHDLISSCEALAEMPINLLLLYPSDRKLKVIRSRDLRGSIPLMQ
jgi:recombinational DNA repair ATPase RecF